MSGSITGNFLYSSLTTLLNVLVPLVTYPYVARVLGPANMGRLGVASSFANYFIAAAGLGFATYGVRTIAMSRKSGASAIGKQSAELFVLALVSGGLATVVYYAAIALVPRYRGDFLLFALFGLTILATNAGIEWFFRGLEEFRFIGLRNVLLQVISVGFLFVLVRKTEDTLLYAALLAGVTVVGALLSLAAARRLLRPDFSGIRPGSHVGPMMIFTLFSFAITAYTNLDFLFLGLVSDTRQAGLYTISIRLTRMVVTVTATLSAVLLPRLSRLAVGDEEEFRRILKASGMAIALFAFPAAAGIAVTAEDLARLFGGVDFTEASASLRILALMVPVAAWSNFLQLQILLPKQHEKAMLFSFGAGFAVTAAAMALLVRPFGHVGAALAMLLGESAVLAGHGLICKKREPALVARMESLPRYALGALFTAGAAFLPYAFMSAGAARLFLSVAAGAGVYFVYLLVLRDPLFMDLLGKLGGPRGGKKRGTGE